MRCDLRSSECMCSAGQCVSAPAKPIEPAGRLSVREQVFVVVALYMFLGSAGLTVWYVSLSWADEHYRVEFLDNQESGIAWKR